MWKLREFSLTKKKSSNQLFSILETYCYFSRWFFSKSILGFSWIIGICLLPKSSKLQKSSCLVLFLQNSSLHSIFKKPILPVENVQEPIDSGFLPILHFYQLFYRSSQGVTLPPRGHYATGICFLDHDETIRSDSIKQFEDQASNLGLQIIAWRQVPSDPTCLGKVARDCEPYMLQVFVKGKVS